MIEADFCNSRICDHIEGRGEEYEFFERYWRTFFCVLKSHKSPCENMSQQSIGGNILCHYGIVQEILESIKFKIIQEETLPHLLLCFFKDTKEIKKNRFQEIERGQEDAALNIIVVQHRKMIQRYLRHLLFLSHQIKEDKVDFQLISGETIYISQKNISRILARLLKQTEDAWGDLS